MFGFKKKAGESDIVDLVQEYEREATPHNDNVPSVFFSVYLHNTKRKIGECDIRIGMNDMIYYAGNIGYRIYEPYRGHGYAYEVCLILMDIAKNTYGMDELIITCTPDNIASRKTIEKLDVTFIEEVDVPTHHWLYKRGETVKRIYRLEL